MTTTLIPIGAFSFAVFSDSTVSGEMVNIIIGRTKLSNLSGTIEESSLKLVAENGMSFQGTIDLDAKVFSGEWTNSAAIISSGTFTANGCSTINY